MDEMILLNRIRVDIGNVSGSITELLQYAQFAGFNDNYEHQAKPRLVGTWTINDWYTTAQLAQAQAAFDGLTIVGDLNYIIDFSQMAVQVLDDTQPNYNPGMAIVLQSKGVGITLESPIIENKEGRWFMTKSQANAYAIPNRTFQSKANVTDNNKIVSTTIASYSQTLLDFSEFGNTGLGKWWLENTTFNCPLIISDRVTTLDDSFYDAVFKYIRFLPKTPPTILDASYLFSSTYKIYVGDGTSAIEDNAVLADYLADTNWARFSSRLDTWYNYLHPQS